jgi:GNAT superfamily N-acetyltransferase
MADPTGTAGAEESSAAPQREIAIVGFDPKLLDGAADLRSRVWGGTFELSREYLAWKYVHNPYLAEPLVHFAVDGSDVVGMRGSMGTCWEVRGKRHVLPHGGDVMVDARFRRQGITRRMQQAYIADLPTRGFRMAFSLSGGSMGTPTMVAGGWHVVVMLDQLECLTGRARLERYVPERWQRRLRRLLGVEARNPFSTLTGSDDGSVQLLGPDAYDRLGEIGSLVPPSGRLRHVRDAEYFRWRLANPLSQYRVLASQDAYVVLEWRGAGSYANLVDWGASDARSLAEVLRVVCRQIRAIRVWDAALDEGLRKTLASLGSLAPNRGLPYSFTLRPLSDDPGDVTLGGLDLNEPESWDFRMLDSDSY